MNIPNVCVAVDQKALKKKEVVLSYFNCTDTDTKVCTNNSICAFSPFSGGDLVRASNKMVTLSTADINRDLACVGKCETCNAKQYTTNASAKILAGIKGAKLHCTLCQTPYKVKCAESLIDSIEEKDEENGANDEMPTDLVGDNRNETLIQASDEEDAGDDLSGDEDEDNSDEDDNDMGEFESDDDDDDSDEDMSDDDDDSDEDMSDDDDSDEDYDFGDDNYDDDSDEDKDEDKDENTSEDEDVPEDMPEGNDNDADNDEGDKEGTSDTTVQASTKTLRINVLESSGGLEGKTLTLVPVNSELALVLANNMPVIKLEAALAGDNASLFASPKKLAVAFEEVMASATNEELDLSKLGAKPINFTVSVANEINQRIKAGIEAVTASLQEKESDVADDYRHCLSIASLMVQRNVDKDIINPYFNEICAQLKKHGVRGDAVVASANSIIEAAGEKFIKVILAKAEELKQKPLETRNEIAKLVEKTPYHSVTASISEEVASKLESGGVPSINPAAFNTREPVTANIIAADQVQEYRSLFKRR